MENKNSYKGVDFKTVRPVLKPKNAQVKDPPRFPSIINPIEDGMKREFGKHLNMMVADLTKAMVNTNKSKK